MVQKTLFTIGLCFALCKGLSFSSVDSLSIEYFVESMEEELNQYRYQFENQIDRLNLEWEEVEKVFKNPSTNQEQLMQAWIRKMEIKEAITMTERKLEIGLDKARYQKGLELIKLMYEKILGLDHHFHSLQTNQNVMQLSNPNSYPEFQQSRKTFEKSLKRKNTISLPNILENNPFLSASFSILTSFLADGSSKEKEADLDEIACILDFTVRMNNDLNLIYYETEFLKASNSSLKEECNKLFKDYSKIIGYDTSLDECRREDDWEKVYILLDNYIEELSQLGTGEMMSPLDSKKFSRGIANLEFSIDRLLDFLNSYTTFISQGEKYYQKFEIILSNYQNEDLCASQLPFQFANMKKDISYSIEKFKDAYFLGELKGSKLKDLLYGEM